MLIRNLLIPSCSISHIHRSCSICPNILNIGKSLICSRLIHYGWIIAPIFFQSNQTFGILHYLVCWAHMHEISLSWSSSLAKTLEIWIIVVADRLFLLLHKLITLKLALQHVSVFCFIVAVVLKYSELLQMLITLTKFIFIISASTFFELHWIALTQIC